jgi:3-oxoacyl-[acyl-carrier protein] reductase
MNNLTGKVCIITGAGRGIGQGLAVELAKHGAHLILNDLEASPLEETISLIDSTHSKIIPVIGSVTTESTANQMIEQVKENFNELNLVFTCAGFTWDTMFHRMTNEQWHSIIDVHLNGTYLVLHKAYPFMRDLGKKEMDEGKIPTPRKIVTVSSMSSFGNLGQANYAAAKAGIIGLTRTLALEGAKFNILANSVAFGAIDTRLTRSRENQDERILNSQLGIPSMAREQYIKQIPLGRFGTIQEAVGPLLFLASDSSNYISGSLIEVNGAAHLS